MAKVIGLGGVFLNFEGDKQQLQDWYETYLQLDMSDYGSGFTSGDQLMLLSFKRNLGQGLINFRVEGIKELLNNICNHGGKLLEKEETPYGEFAIFMDPFGNKIELWEANVAAYKQMVEEELKAYQLKK